MADIVKIGGPMRPRDFVRLGKQRAGFCLNPTLIFEKFGSGNIQPARDSLDGLRQDRVLSGQRVISGPADSRLSQQAAERHPAFRTQSL